MWLLLNDIPAVVLHNIVEWTVNNSCFMISLQVLILSLNQLEDGLCSYISINNVKG